MSMQTFDAGTLTTIRRKNIKVEKYHELSAEFRRNDLPMMVDIMMGLPGSTPTRSRDDLQECIEPRACGWPSTPPCCWPTAR